MTTPLVLATGWETWEGPRRTRRAKRKRPPPSAAGAANSTHAPPCVVLRTDAAPETVIPPHSVGFNLHEDLHRGFAEVLKQMGSDTSDKTYRVASRYDHPLYLSIMSLAATAKEKKEIVVSRQLLPLVRRAHEEAYMRPAVDGERPCASGCACEGRLLAHFLHGDPDKGFVAVCVLCLRKQTSVDYYTSRAHGGCESRVLLPYRNIVCAEGEYKRSACLYMDPRKFDGLSDPFVRHERHHYSFQRDPPCLTQHGVDFRLSPPTTSSCLA
jgi:hypothetical protein